MKLFLVCSKAFYGNIPPIQQELEKSGHEVVLPNCYDDPDTEARYKQRGDAEHAAWKAEMFEQSRQTIQDVDAVLVLNFEKNGQPNYIGGATFLEMYDAFRAGKRIYLYNDIPNGMLHDEIEGFAPVLLNHQLDHL